MCDEPKEQSDIASGLREAIHLAVPASARAGKRKVAAEFELLLETIEEENKAGRTVDLPALMAAARKKR